MSLLDLPANSLKKRVERNALIKCNPATVQLLWCNHIQARGHQQEVPLYHIIQLCTDLVNKNRPPIQERRNELRYGIFPQAKKNPRNNMLARIPFGSSMPVCKHPPPMGAESEACFFKCRVNVVRNCVAKIQADNQVQCTQK